MFNSDFLAYKTWGCWVDLIWHCIIFIFCVIELRRTAHCAETMGRLCAGCAPPTRQMLLQYFSYTRVDYVCSSYVALRGVVQSD